MKICSFVALGFLFFLANCSDPPGIDPDRTVDAANGNSGLTAMRVAQVGALGRPTVERSAKSYFVEFRSRAAANYGHMYVIYGQLNAGGEVIESRIAGLHPAGDAYGCENCSVVPWITGHVIFVPSETGASNGDLEEKYVTAYYRVRLDRAAYEKTAAYIKQLQADNPLWNVVWNNCISFASDIARFVGLQVPGSNWSLPPDFINELRRLNGGGEQPPLISAPNMTGPASSPSPTLAEWAPSSPMWWQFIALDNGERKASARFATAAECDAVLKSTEAALRKAYPDRYPLVGSCEEYPDR
jgi:hypothetical protein